jgi:hypothetical protein
VPASQNEREWFCVPGDRRQARQRARDAKPEESRLESQTVHSFAHDTVEAVRPLDKAH